MLRVKEHSLEPMNSLFLICLFTFILRDMQRKICPTPQKELYTFKLNLIWLSIIHYIDAILQKFRRECVYISHIPKQKVNSIHNWFHSIHLFPFTAITFYIFSSISLLLVPKTRFQSLNEFVAMKCDCIAGCVQCSVNITELNQWFFGRRMVSIQMVPNSEKENWKQKMRMKKKIIECHN